MVCDVQYSKCSEFKNFNLENCTISVYSILNVSGILYLEPGGHPPDGISFLMYPFLLSFFYSSYVPSYCTLFVQSFLLRHYVMHLDTDAHAATHKHLWPVISICQRLEFISINKFLIYSVVFCISSGSQRGVVSYVTGCNRNCHVAILRFQSVLQLSI